MNWVIACIHRQCLTLLVIVRIIFKYTAFDAADVQAMAISVKQARSKRASSAQMTRVAIITGRMFATKASKKATDEMLSQPNWTFTAKHMQALLETIQELDMADRLKLSDLAVTLTGDAWLSRVLDNTHGKRKKNLESLEQAVTKLTDIQIWSAQEIYFADVVDIASSIPLLGDTLSVNFTRQLSAARVGLGLSPLVMDDRGFEKIKNMHTNVSEALALCQIHDADDARAACDAISALMAMSYGGSARYTCRRIDEADLALQCCEYRCCLKEAISKKWCKGDEEQCSRFLLARLPSTLESCQQLRKRIVSMVQHNDDLCTGHDGARARNNLVWWWDSLSPRATPAAAFLSSWGTMLHCATCEEVLDHKRALDPRARFCCAECKSEALAASRKRKRVR